jgi:hypothetical protein
MGDEEEEELLPNWEAVVGEDGRTYYWNVDTDETTWTKPVAVKATSAIAAAYVANAGATSSGGASSSARELESLRANSSAVSQLSQRFSNQQISGRDDEDNNNDGVAVPSGKRGSGT